MSRFIQVLLLVSAVGLAGCAKGSKTKKAPSLGRKVAEDGEIAKVVANPDGSWLAYLGQIEHPHDLGVPEGVLQGILEVVPSDGSKTARPLVGGVTNMEGGFGFSSDGRMLAALKGFRFQTQTGTLELVDVRQATDPLHLADDCGSFGFSPDAHNLAWVAGGAAFLSRADGSGARRLVDSAATVDFSRDSRRLLIRKQASAGGDLLVVEVDGAAAPRLLAAAVGDYVFAPSGEEVAFTTHDADAKGGWNLAVIKVEGGAQPRLLGNEVAHFQFSPDGQWLAYLAGITPSKAFGDLWVAPASGGAGRKLGDRVDEFRFAPGSRALAFLEHYDANAGSGMLSVQQLPPTEPNRVLYRPVKNFGWSPEGGYLAYTSLLLHPDVSVDLDLVDMKEIKPGAALPDGGSGWATGPRKVATGAFGFEFVSEKTLIYRMDCVMEGRACDLFELPTYKPAMPARITGGVWKFVVSSDRSRLLVTYPRLDSESVADLGAINLLAPGAPVGLDSYVEPGAQFLDPQGRRVAYGVIHKGRNGVYVADVPLSTATDRKDPFEGPPLPPHK